MGSTSLPAPPPNFGFGVVKLGFLRRTASPGLLHSITALDRTTQSLLPPSRVMLAEQRSVPALLILTFAQLPLLSCRSPVLWFASGCEQPFRSRQPSAKLGGIFALGRPVRGAFLGPKTTRRPLSGTALR